MVEALSDRLEALCDGCAEWLGDKFFDEDDEPAVIVAPMRVHSLPQSPLQVGPAAFAAAGCRWAAIRRPRRWPGAREGGTDVAAMYDESHLWLCYVIQGGSFEEPSAARRAAATAAAAASAPTSREDDEYAWCRDQCMPPEMWSILADDRVELFLWAQDPRADEGGKQGGGAAAEAPLLPAKEERSDRSWTSDRSTRRRRAREARREREALRDEAGQAYFCMEVNRAGEAIQARVAFRKNFDWGWRAQHTAVYLERDNTRSMVIKLPWASVGIKPRPGLSLRAALCRGERAGAGAAGAAADGAGDDGGEGGGISVWSSWTDPRDDVVDFHRSQCFGELLLSD
eukprot:g1414.t1